MLVTLAAVTDGVMISLKRTVVGNGAKPRPGHSSDNVQKDLLLSGGILTKKKLRLTRATSPTNLRLYRRYTCPEETSVCVVSVAFEFAEEYRENSSLIAPSDSLEGDSSRTDVVAMKVVNQRAVF